MSQNDNLSTSIVRLLCQQSKSSYNMNAASDRFILHTMQYIMYLQKLYHKRVFRSVSVNQRFIHEFISSVSLCILHRFLVIFFNSKLDVFHVLQPCQLCFSSLLLSYYLYWIQKYGLTSLNDRITCNFRIINQFT